MCEIQGPRILGKIDMSQFPAPVSRYSTCDECGHRATQGIYIRPDGVQRCEQCENWQEIAANDDARSIFDTHV